MTNIELISESLQMQGNEKLYKHFLNNQLLTYAEWKKKGYTVVKGQKASFKCEVWKRTKNKKYKEGSKEKEYLYFKKVASFFTIEQVKPIK